MAAVEEEALAHLQTLMEVMVVQEEVLGRTRAELL